MYWVSICFGILVFSTATLGHYFSLQNCSKLVVHVWLAERPSCVRRMKRTNQQPGTSPRSKGCKNSSGKCHLLTLFRFPKPILWIAAVFHSGRGGWNWTPDGWLLSTPRGSVINTASPLNVCVVVMDDLLVLWVTISTPDGKWKTPGQFSIITACCAVVWFIGWEFQRVSSAT